MSVQKRHQNDTKDFDELTYSEQAKSINIHTVWYLDATKNHIRRCAEEHGAARAADSPQESFRSAPFNGGTGRGASGSSYNNSSVHGGLTRYVWVNFNCILVNSRRAEAME